MGVVRAWSFTMWAKDTPMVKHARQAVRDGFAVVFLRPGTKEPICPLNERERRKAGNRHPCGVSHASTDEKWVVRTCTRLERDYGRINLGIAAHASGVVVIDADTPEQVESVQELLRQMGEVEALLGQQPTVQTPGAEIDGVWVHSGGTHWYFNRPDGLDLPEYPGQLGLAGGAVMRWGNTYTVVPPSERPEGRYVSLAEVIPDVPAGLVHLILDHVMRRAERAAEAVSLYTNEPVVEWSVRVQWHELLEPQGWQYLGKLDRQCGCPVWRRPGDGTTSDRSAIAHENDCEVRENREGHGSLHVFSDNVPGRVGEQVADGVRDFTKLQFVALTDHDGDDTAAQIALGLSPDYGEMWGNGPPDNGPDPYTLGNQNKLPDDDPDDIAPAQEAHPLTLLSKKLSDRTGIPIGQAMKAVGDEWMLRERRAVLDEYLGSTAVGASWLPVGQEALLIAAGRDRTPSVEGVLMRSDGAMVFTVGKLHELFGQSSSGKTFLMMVAALQQVRAGHRVLFCDFEDNVDTFIDRFMIDLGVDVLPFITSGLLRYSNPSETPGDMAPLIAMGFRLVVVDSLSEVVSATADGSMKDGVLLRRIMGLFRKLAEAGAAVVLIAHGSEKVDVPGSSLGASEIRQALTGQDVLLHIDRSFDKRTAGRSLIYIAKDRGGDASGDTDTNDGALNKVQRRLWGAMVVSPRPPDVLLGTSTWTTSIEVEPAKHVDPAAKEKAIDRAERLVISYLLGKPDESAKQSAMTDDLVDENDGLVDRTVRRAVQKLLDDRMVHEVGSESPAGGGRPSPIIKLGPAPEEAA